jgi:hypothetical protein
MLDGVSLFYQLIIKQQNNLDLKSKMNYKLYFYLLLAIIGGGFTFYYVILRYYLSTKVHLIV